MTISLILSPFKSVDRGEDKVAVESVNACQFCENDIKYVKELNNKNIEGIIVGKAIYDGDIKLDELAKEIDA